MCAFSVVKLDELGFDWEPRTSGSLRRPIKEASSSSSRSSNAADNEVDDDDEVEAIHDSTDRRNRGLPDAQSSLGRVTLHCQNLLTNQTTQHGMCVAVFTGSTLSP